MTNYIDGFVLPVPKKNLEDYRAAAQQVSLIWKEYGALSYLEFVGEDLHLEGTRSFLDLVDANEDEAVVFGWVVFPSKEVRDDANAKVPADPRMTGIIAPLLDPERPVFDPTRMAYGGFEPLVK